MNRLAALAAVLALAAAPAALANLSTGDKAPAFTAQASMAGKAFPFDLKKALKKGPVVLYFFPAAFTPGCTIEAHDFAEASDQYKALGATLIGVTAGNINRLTEFSVSECRSKFAVAADPDAKIAGEYKSVLAEHAGYSNRTSYVIAPDGKVLLVYSNMNPDDHVSQTLAALKTWRAKHPM
jgi:peroxiredoxin